MIMLANKLPGVACSSQIRHPILIVPQVHDNKQRLNELNGGVMYHFCVLQRATLAGHSSGQHDGWSLGSRPVAGAHV